MKKIGFTGERMVPTINKGATLYYEHILRYLFASRFVKNKRVLDLGSGTGYGCTILLKAGAKKVDGIDISKEAIDYSKSSFGSKNLQFFLRNITDLSFLKATYQVITALEVIEHVKDQNKFLSEVKKKLNATGLFIVSTPNTLTYPKGNPYHINELTREKFERLLKKYFRYVKTVNQFFVLSNILLPHKDIDEEIMLGFDKVFHFKQIGYYSKLNPKNSQYLVAVCSDVRLKSIEPVTVFSDKVDSIDFTKGTAKVNKLYQKVVENDAEIAELNRALNEIKSAKTFKIWQTFVSYKNAVKSLIRFNNG